MIVVLVRIDQEPDRFVGDESDDFFDYGEAALLAQGRLDDRDEVFELHRDAVVGGAAQQVHAVCKLFSLDGYVKTGLDDRIGDRDRIRALIRLDFFECTSEGIVSGVDALDLVVVVPALMGVPGNREANAVAQVGITVVDKFVFVVEVAKYGVGHPGVDALQQVFAVDGRIDPILSEDRDGDDPDLFRRRGGTIAAHLSQLPAPGRDGVGARQPRGLQETVRVEPHVQLPARRIFGTGGDRLGFGAILVPAVLAVDHEPLPGILLDGGPPDPAQTVLPGSGVLSGRPVERLHHDAGFPVHHPGIVVQLSAGPVDVITVETLLPHHAAIT